MNEPMINIEDIDFSDLPFRDLRPGEVVPDVDEDFDPWIFHGG